MDELQETVETLIDLDEPEAILPTLRRAAARKKGLRWQRLAQVLGEAEASLERAAAREEHARQGASLLEEPPADAEAKSE